MKYMFGKRIFRFLAMFLAIVILASGNGMTVFAQEIGEQIEEMIENQEEEASEYSDEENSEEEVSEYSDEENLEEEEEESESFSESDDAEEILGQLTSETADDEFVYLAGGKMLSVGDYLFFGKYNGKPILWRCVDIDENGPLLLSDKILSIKCFDAKGDSDLHAVKGSSFPNIRKQYGSNCYSESNLRQWLNSTEEKVSWTHNAPSSNNVENGYNAYDNEAGFLSSSNFSQDEIACIKFFERKVYTNEAEGRRGVTDGGTKEHVLKVDNLYSCNYDFANCYYQNVADKIFIPDILQIKAIYDNLGIEAVTATPTSEAVSRSSYSTSTLVEEGNFQYWINHAGTNGACYEWVYCVNNNGDYGNYRAYQGVCGVRPALYLDDNVCSIGSGAGTKESPFRLETTEMEKRFNAYCYQADFVLENSDIYNDIIDTMAEETYCGVISEGVSNFESFIIELFRNKGGFIYIEDPKTLDRKKVEIQDEDLYFALILSVLKDSSRKDVSDIYVDTIDDVAYLSDKTMAVFDGIDMATKKSELSPSELDEYNSVIKSSLTVDELDMVGPFIDVMMNSAETFGDFWNEFTNMMCLKRLDKATRDTLIQWRDIAYTNSGKDSDLYRALNRAVSYFEDSVVINYLNISARYSEELLWQVYWDISLEVIEKIFPAIEIVMLIYDLSHFGVNILANTDAIVETKINCVIMNEIIESLDLLCYQSISRYLSNPNEENARTMMKSIELMYSSHALDRDCASAFIQELDARLIDEMGGVIGELNKRISSYESYDEAIEQLEKESEDIRKRAKNVKTLWVTSLKETHPDSGLYERYSDMAEKLKGEISKSYTFACPVDVRVVCGDKESYYKNGILHTEDEVAIVVQGDKKIVYLLTDADYYIFLEGTDVGEMTVRVKTYGESESTAVYKEYRNVPLSVETTYSMKASNVVKDETYDVLMNGKDETEYVANEERYQISLENASLCTERGERFTEALLARGESAYIHAEDIVGYEFTEWSVNGDVIIEELTSANTIIHVGTQASVIKANYVKVAETYTISATENEGGDIHFCGEITVCEGESRTFYIVPAYGYEIYCVLVDGINIGKVSEYTFENVTQNHTIIASFKKTESAGEQDDVLPEDVPKDGIVPDGIWVSGITAYDYTGAAVKQSFRVYDKYTLLKENTDYTISYKNNKNAYTYTEEDYQEYLEGNSAAAVGTFNPKKAPQVILKMKGNYSGSRTIYFRINPVELDAETIVAEDLTVTYMGKKQTPTPKVTWNGKALKYGTDFYVPEYDATKKDKKAFTEKGTYTLTLTGKKNFTGELPITLAISESVKQIAIDKVTVKGIKDMPYTGEQLKPAGFSVKYKNDVLTEEGGDYTISWGENIAVGTGTITFTGTGLDTDGDGITYIGSKVVKFKITGISMSKTMVTGVEKQYGYTGEAIEPIGNVTYKAGKEGNEIALQKDVHYSVEYQKNLEKGTATIVYSGLAEGGYTGTKKVTFKIVSRNISDMTEDGTTLEQVQVAYVDESNLQDGIYNAPFMKGGAKPDVTVSINDIVLTQGKDYTISYSNNKKVASATDKKAPTITIKGKGNYSGTKKVSYAIVPKPLSNENGITVVAKDKAVSTGKNGYRQSFKVYDADGKALGSADYDAKNVTYTLIQTENEDGSMKEENIVLDKTSVVAANSVILITVTGKGNYAGGAATGTYRILQSNHDISKATIQIKNQEYTGNPVMINEQSQFKEGKVYMKVGKETRVLELGKDIEVVPGSYVKNVNKGTAKVTFRGIGDFGGTKTVSYKIGARSINEIWQGIFSKFSDWFNANVADEERLSSASVPCHTSVCT